MRESETMLYRYSVGERERLRHVYETTARDVLAGSIFGGVPVQTFQNDGDSTLEAIEEGIQAMQVVLNAAVSYVKRISDANPGYTAQQTKLLVSLVSTLLVKQHDWFQSQLVRFHAHVLSEIGHNDDSRVINDLLRKLADLSANMRVLRLTKLTLETAHVALRAHLLDMTEHLSSTQAEGDEDSTEVASSGILEDVLDYVDHRLSAYVTALDVNEHDQARLTQPVYEVVQEQRIRNLFDLVIEYPDSLPALGDLKACIKHTKKYGMLIHDFSRSVTRRLLHPGAATSDIIQHYMSTIKVLKYIEPSGYILDIISKPIQRYLRSRKDAIKNIVLLLTEDDDDDGGEFGGEASAAASLFRSGGVEGSITGMNQFYGSDEVAFASIKSWAPAPLEIAYGVVGRGGPGGPAGPAGRHVRKSRVRSTTYASSFVCPSNDTISLLTDIYGTKELFLSAYRSMLAERLVHKIDFDCTKELKTLELLKIRFGEAALQNAEIMMRDVNDSKRLNAVIQSGGRGSKGGTGDRGVGIGDRGARGDHGEHFGGWEENPNFFSSLRVLVTSDQYWPSLSKDDAIDFTLPADVEAATSLFAKRYHSQKAPRTLKWKKSIGEVCLDLTLGEETVEFNVSPIQATILLAFECQSEYSLAQLAERLKLPEPMILQNAIFWINEGVMRLEKTQSNVQVLHRNEVITRPMTTIDVDEGEDKEDGIDASMEYLEPFIVGMLTNFDGLPLERIHNMLKMFVTDPPYDRNIDDLSRLLESMVGRGICTYEQSGRIYRKHSE